MHMFGENIQYFGRYERPISRIDVNMIKKCEHDLRGPSLKRSNDIKKRPLCGLHKGPHESDS